MDAAHGTQDPAPAVSRAAGGSSRPSGGGAAAVLTVDPAVGLVPAAALGTAGKRAPALTARNDLGSRTRGLLGLQRAVGNAGVARLELGVVPGLGQRVGCGGGQDGRP